MLCVGRWWTDHVGVAAQVWPEGLNGIEIKVEGFSHKLPLLTTSIVQQLVSLKVRRCSNHLFPLASHALPDSAQASLVHHAFLCCSSQLPDLC
jgi:secreted Zn-dependent insulinase-like peptidase